MEGAVNHILDVFLNAELNICGEIYQNVAFDLLSAAGERDQLQVVYAQSQASALCRGWLRRHLPRAIVRETDTTARAIAKASDHPGAAVLASSKVAPDLGLHVLATSINDSARCLARFLIVGKRAAQPSGKDKTSVMFVADDYPGALQRVLTPISKAGINLINITSHPTGHAGWKDFFLVDLQGHRDDPPAQRVLAEMGAACRYLKCLGSYPRADTAAASEVGDTNHAD
jgi:chorismate mutase/prephenate dehydratase